VGYCEQRGAAEMSGAFGEGVGVWMEEPIWDDFQVKSEAQPAGSQPWVIAWLALGPVAWVVCLPHRPGWSSTRTAVRGHGG
jgi:hypothetical protein